MLILDTSVILNFLGSGRPRFILENLGQRTFLPHAVLQEVQKEPQLAGASDASLTELISSGLLGVLEPTEEINQLALDLAGAPAPDDLDDGESYAIACAVVKNGVIGIDEQKGRRIVLSRWPSLPRQFSIELIEISVLRAKIDNSEYAEIVYAALKNARMRIPKDRRPEVISLVGRNRAKQCPSLGIVF
jgi:hypothetical protein